MNKTLNPADVASYDLRAMPFLMGARGVNSDRLPELWRDVQNLCGYDFADFAKPVSEGVRSTARWLFALMDEADTLDMARTWRRWVGTETITVDEVAKLAAGNDNEPSAQHLARIGACLREGMTVEATAEQCGVSHGAVRNLSKWMGVADWRREELFDEAYDAFTEGVPVEEFCAEHGKSASWGRTLYAQARKVAAELDAFYAA